MGTIVVRNGTESFGAARILRGIALAALAAAIPACGGGGGGGDGDGPRPGSSSLRVSWAGWTKTWDLFPPKSWTW